MSWWRWESVFCHGKWFSGWTEAAFGGDGLVRLNPNSVSVETVELLSLGQDISLLAAYQNCNLKNQIEMEQQQEVFVWKTLVSVPREIIQGLRILERVRKKSWIRDYIRIGLTGLMAAILSPAVWSEMPASYCREFCRTNGGKQFWFFRGSEMTDA